MEELAPSVIEIRASGGPYGAEQAAWAAALYSIKTGTLPRTCTFIWYGIEGGTLDVRLDSEPDTPYLAEWIAGGHDSGSGHHQSQYLAGETASARLAEKVIWGKRSSASAIRFTTENTLTRGCIS
jgi:hypothetical protein